MGLFCALDTRFDTRLRLKPTPNPDPNNYRPAKLYEREGDLIKRWFVAFFALDPMLGKLVRSKQIWCPTKFKSSAARRAWAKPIIHELNKRLTEGHIFETEPPPQPEPAPTPIRSTMDMRPTLFIEALDRLADLRGLTHRSRTHDTNRNTVNLWNQFCTWLLTEKQIDLVNMPVDRLTLSDLNAFSDYIIQVRKNASRTRKNLIGDLRTLFNSMVSREWLPKNSFPE